jgi:hypothetical protein
MGPREATVQGLIDLLDSRINYTASPEMLKRLEGLLLVTLKDIEHVRREAKEEKKEYVYSCGYCGSPNPPQPPSEVYGPGVDGWPICPDCHGC